MTERHYNETRLDATLWNEQFGLWEWDLKSEQVHWLNDWCATLNLDPCPTDNHEYHWNQRRHPADRAVVEQAWLAHLTGTTEWFEAEYRVQTLDGGWRWIGERGKVVQRGPDGEPLRMIGACFDIHQRRMREMNLRLQQQSLQVICENVPAWMLILDREGRIEYANRGIRNLPASQAVGHQLVELLMPSNRERLRQLMQEVSRTLAPRDYVLTMDSDQGLRHFEGHLAPVLVDGELSQLAGIAIEVTERRELERTVVETVSREQRRISHDLHDGLGQELFGVSLLLRSVLGRSHELTDESREQLEQIDSLVRNAVATTRSIARGLAPVAHGYAGLVDALQVLAQRLGRHGAIRLQYDLAAHIGTSIDTAVAEQLYRIGYEALVNAMRHSNANRVLLRLQAHQGELCLEVEDDGCGYSVDDAVTSSTFPLTSGLGMKIMSYRAESIGAVLDIVSAPHSGTRVSCRWPLDGVGR